MKSDNLNNHTKDIENLPNEVETEKRREMILEAVKILNQELLSYPLPHWWYD